jgi:hypothetical protein
MTLVKKALSAIAVLSLVACSSMPSWMGGGSKVHLTGAEEVPPVSTSASGDGKFSIGSDGSVKGSVNVSGMQAVAAHIHMGAKGQNGPVIVPLTKSGDSFAAPEGAKLNDAQLAAYKAGNLYVNVHSPQHKGGEIRAQLQP